MYYIYHIKGVKIGCTDNVKKRMRQQNFTHYEILEIHTCKYKVSDREIELQKEYGYPVDSIPYWKTLKNGTTKKAIIAKKNNGKIVGNWAVESGHLEKVNNLPQSIEAKRANGRKAGELAKKLGTLKKAGMASGQKAYESGRLAEYSEKRKRQVMKYDLNNNFISKYSSIKEAAHLNNLHPSSVGAVCRGRAKCKTAGGFVWKYDI